MGGWARHTSAWCWGCRLGAKNYRWIRKSFVQIATPPVFGYVLQVIRIAGQTLKLIDRTFEAQDSDSCDEHSHVGVSPNHGLHPRLWRWAQRRYNLQASWSTLGTLVRLIIKLVYVDTEAKEDTTFFMYCQPSIDRPCKTPHGCHWYIDLSSKRLHLRRFSTIIQYVLEAFGPPNWLVIYFFPDGRRPFTLNHQIPASCLKNVPHLMLSFVIWNSIHYSVRKPRAMTSCSDIFRLRA